MRYLTYVGSIENMEPYHHSYRNVGVTYIADETVRFKTPEGRTLCIRNGFIVTRPSLNTQEYMPYNTYYGYTLEVGPVKADDAPYGVDGNDEMDSDLLATFKRICMKHIGHTVYLRTQGKNKGKFYILRKYPEYIPNNSMVSKSNFGRRVL